MKTYTTLHCEKCDSEEPAKDYPRRRQDCSTDEDWSEWKDEPMALCEKCATDLGFLPENADVMARGDNATPTTPKP